MDTIIRLIHVLLFIQNMPILMILEELWCVPMAQTLQEFSFSTMPNNLGGGQLSFFHFFANLIHLLSPSQLADFLTQYQLPKFTLQCLCLNFRETLTFCCTWTLLLKIFWSLKRCSLRALFYKNIFNKSNIKNIFTI